MFKLRKSETVGAIEKELRTLSDRLQKIKARRTELAVKAEAARDSRRAVLSGTDEGLIEKATADVRAIGQEIVDVNELAADLAAAIETANERLDAARTASDRAASAARLRDLATVAEKSTPRLDKAVQELAQAARALISEIPEDLAVFQIHYSARTDGGQTAPARPTEVVGALLAEALDAVLPEIFNQTSAVGSGYGRSLVRFNKIESDLEIRAYNQFGPAHRLPEAMKMLIIDRLKARAAAIDAGEASTNLTDIQPSQPQRKKKKYPQVHLFAKSVFTFSIDGGRKQTVSWRSSIWAPSDVADAAIAAGAAVLMESDEGRKFFEEEQARRQSEHWAPSHQREEDWIHLGNFSRDQDRLEAAE